MGYNKIYWNNYTNILWVGSRNIKLHIFPNKITIGGDERYFLCAAVVVWIVSRLIGSSSVFCNEWLFLYA